jgi:hypothetical protein
MPGAHWGSAAVPPAWRRAGRLSDAEQARISQEALRHIARPTLQALLAAHSPARGVRVGAGEVA